MRESKTSAVSHDGQSFFFSEVKRSNGRTDDPNDFYKALDMTFKDNQNGFFKQILSKVPHWSKARSDFAIEDSNKKIAQKDQMNQFDKNDDKK